MQVPSLNDHQLISRYLEGDERSFEILLNRHEQKLFTQIYLFVRDKSLAEDIFQDVLIKIIDTLRKGKYNHEGKFLQWAARIAQNMCVDYFRRTKRRPKMCPTEAFDLFDLNKNAEHLVEVNAEQFIIRSQTHDRIRTLVDMLPAEQREVVILRHYADMSFKEIAKLTRVSINTSLGRMRYALINIRKMVEEKEVILQ